MKRGSWILKMMLLGAIAMTLLGFVTQLLWNWLVPNLFGGPMITIWQALGLFILSKILFWPFGKRHYGGYRGVYSKSQWKEKWNNMSEEEKLQFRQKMKDKCGWSRPAQEENPPVQ